MRRTLTSILIFICTFLSTLAQSWEPIGPNGGWAQRVEFDPFANNTIYLGGDFLHGLAKSSNNGDNWERVESYPTVDAWNLVLDYNNVGTLFAGTMMTPTNFNPYLLKSTDYGTSWDTIFKDIHITDLSLDPANSDIIYLGAGQWQSNPARGYGHGVYKSADGGENFTNIGLDTLSIQTIKVHPLFSNVIFAGAYDLFGNRPKGVFASTDAGGTWFEAGLQDKQVRKITIGDTADSVVFVACFDSLYRSQDFGNTWRALNVPSDAFWDVDISLSDNNIIYTSTLSEANGGVFKSVDGGDTWNKITGSVNSNRFWSISIHPSNPDLIFTTTQGDGVFRSQDGGTSWEAVNDGYSAHYISTVVPDGKGGIYGGFYNEHGNSFSSLMHWNEEDGWTDSGYEVDNLIQSIAVDPSDVQNILLADVTQNFISPEGGTTYYSTNSGTSFTPTNGKPSNLFFEKIVIDRTDGNRVLGASSEDLGFLNGDGIFISLDSGKNWINSGFDGVSVTDVIQDKFNPDKFYCSPYLKGFWSSNDHGVTWDSLGFGGWPLILDLEQDAFNRDVFYASSFENGVLKSSDGGLTWETIGFDGITISSIISDPRTESVIYAGGAGQRLPGVGVWKSENSGKDWEDISDGLASKVIDEVSIDSLSGCLFACTQGEGIFRLKINDPLLRTFSEKSDSETQISYSSNTGLILKSQTPGFNFIITDLSGKEVLTGSSQNKSKTVNLSNLRNTIYVVTLINNEGKRSEKIMKN